MRWSFLKASNAKGNSIHGHLLQPTVVFFLVSQYILTVSLQILDRFSQIVLRGVLLKRTGASSYLKLKMRFWHLLRCSSLKVNSGRSHGSYQVIELKNLHNKVLDNMLPVQYWYQARAHKQISVELLQLEVSQTMKPLTTRALHSGRHTDLSTYKMQQL